MATAEKIIMEPVTSTNILALGYNPVKKILAVQFRSGAIFHYGGVELATALGFLQTDSIGRYYAATIKGKYSGQRMTGPCPTCGHEGWVGERCACGAADYEEKPYATPEADGQAQPVQGQDQPAHHVSQRRRRQGAGAAPVPAAHTQR